MYIYSQFFCKQDLVQVFLHYLYYSIIYCSLDREEINLQVYASLMMNLIAL